MGRLHAERLHSSGRGQVAALYDAEPAAAKRLQQDLAPKATLLPSLEEVSDLHQLEAAIICTPTSLHFEQVRRLLPLGLSILCEKPLADTRQRMNQLIVDADTARGQTMLAYQRRFWATYRTLRREVRSGRWGKILAVTSHNTERWQQTIPGTWRDDPDINPGGFLGDAGSHKLDALFYVTGLNPREVFARTQSCGSQVAIVASVSAMLDGEVPLTMDFVGHAEHQSEDLTIHCEEADLMIRDWRVWIARENRVTPLAPLEPHADPVTGFLDLLEGTGENLAPFSAARPVFDLTDMILESARTHRPVTRSSS